MFASLPSFVFFWHDTLSPENFLVYTSPKQGHSPPLHCTVFSARKSTLVQHCYPIHRPHSNDANHPNNVPLSFLVQDPSQYHELPLVVMSHLILMCLIVLKSRVLSFCRLTLDPHCPVWPHCQIRSYILGRNTTEMILAFSAEYYIRRHTVWIHPTTGDVNFDHLIKLVSSPSPPFYLMSILWGDIPILHW